MSAQESSVAATLAASAAGEWAQLVTAAVLGTDRRVLPPPAPGWDRLRGARGDAAVELLDRVAAVATARRAGVEPAPAPARLLSAPADPRPPCPPAAALILSRLLRGEHDLLLPEWLGRCAAAGMQPPAHLVPALLLRGRRSPTFDIAARAAIGARAAWLAEAMPELGVKPAAAPATGGETFAPPPAPPDSGAVVTAIVSAFVDRVATWAAVGQMRLAVAAIDPQWLPALVLDLNRAPFHAVTERTRLDLLGLAQMRSEMVRALAPLPPTG